MRASEHCVERIKTFEGCRLESYKCPGGIWTIGYGHTLGVTEGMSITQEVADFFLLKDLHPFEVEVNRLGTWNQHQFDALVSFAFNVGIGNLKNSTLLKKIRLGASNDDIRREFMRWIYADGKPLPGLKRRRAWEADTYLKPQTS